MSWITRTSATCLLGVVIASLAAFTAQLLVSQDGTSAYQTITEALNVAAYGDKVYVGPGVYNEGLVFKNGVTLVGSGAGSTVVRYGYGFEPVIRVAHASAGRIEGFTFERTEMTLPASVVMLESASILIADCTVLGGQVAGIEIAEATSHVSLKRLNISANFGHGVWLRDGARATLTQCEIRNNQGNGLLITDASALIGESIRIERNGAHAVTLEDTASTVLMSSDLSDHPGWNVNLQEEALLQLIDCRLTQGDLGGIRLRGDAYAYVEDCTLSDGGVGIEARERSFVDLRQSVIRDVTGNGVSLQEDSGGRILRTRVVDCTGHGLVLASTTDVDVNRVTLVGNGGSGLVVQGGSASITNSIIAYNDGTGIDIQSQGSASADHNNVWNNRGGDYQGIMRRTSDLSAPPDFVNLSAGDLRLRPDSPCIGAGSLWTTIGAFDDPNLYPTTTADVSALVGSFGGVDLFARIRSTVHPFELDSILCGASYVDERVGLRVETAFAGAWGSRTTGKGRFEFADIDLPIGQLRGRIEVNGVLDGLASRMTGALTADVVGSSLDAALRVSRTWPSTRWITEANASLGDVTRVYLSARAADLFPEDLAAGVRHTVETDSRTFVADAGLSLGQTRQASLDLSWITPARSVSARGAVSLEDLGYWMFDIGLQQPSDDVSASLAVRFAALALDDVIIRASKGFGAADVAVSLGINAAGQARLSLTIAADLRAALSPPDNELPVAQFTVIPDDPQAEEPVTFDASLSADPDGQLVDFWWDFGDGAVTLGMTATHAYATDGTYSVTLSVVDTAGATSSIELPVVIWPRNTAPAAAFVWEPVSDAGTRLPRPLRSGDSVRLDASESLDPIGGVLTFHWDLESDGQFDLMTADPIVVVPPLASGTHPVTLRVVTEEGRVDAVMHAILVAEPKAPLAGFSHSPEAPSILDPVRFIDQSSDSDGSVIAWHWSFGDGSTSRLREPTHQYAAAGSYNVQQTTTDDDGQEDSVTTVIEVAAIPEIVPVNDVWILAIGISDYTDVADLSFGRDDALAVVAWAAESGAPNDHVRLLTDTQGLAMAPPDINADEATLVNVRESLGWLRRVAQPDDLVLIFFSGHGYQGLDDGSDERDGVDEFFVLLDTVAGAVDDTALRDDEFGRFLDRLLSEHVLVLFDGCHSGGLSRSLPSGHRPTTETLDLFRDFSLEGRLILSAAGEAQDAFESPALGHGVFTYFALEGLRGRADLNGDSHVTAWELYEYILAEVPAFVRDERGAEQIPQIVGEGDVRVVVSAAPQSPSPGISFEPTVPFAGGLITFTDETLGEAVFRLWSFGDGTFSTHPDPTHTFLRPGTYTVELVVRASSGATVGTQTDITIAPAGQVIAVEELVLISLGRRNGIEIGNRFLAVLEDPDDAVATSNITLEVVELIDEDTAGCRLLDGETTPAVGDEIRPLPESLEN